MTRHLGERTLVHIVNTEILRRWERVKAFAFDLDGSLTSLHTPLIYNLMWESVLESLEVLARENKNGNADNLRRKLQGYSFSELAKGTHVPLGWFLDTELGYLVLTDISGRIIGVRDGDEIFTREKAMGIYKFFIADISDMPNPDHQKPRFLPICDGFDYVEAFVKSVAYKYRSPRKTTLEILDQAFYRAHRKDGFKKKIQQNPEEYGISYDPKLAGFLEKLVERGIVLAVVTSSNKEYTNIILETLGIRHLFKFIEADATKPQCFNTPYDKNPLWNRISGFDIQDPKDVVYVGDHLIKDGSAHELGFFTVLRMRREDIIRAEAKMFKYGGIRFRQDGTLRKMVTGANKDAEKELNSFLIKIYRHISMMTPKVQYLERVFH